MKIIPSVYVTANGKDGKRITYPAGEPVDLPKEVAQDLLDRGFARLPGDEVEVAESSGPSVTSESGPQIIPAE